MKHSTSAAGEAVVTTTHDHLFDGGPETGVSCMICGQPWELRD